MKDPAIRLGLFDSGGSRVNSLIVQIGYSTKGGGVVPLAVSRDTGLVNFVGQHILNELSEARFEDELLNVLTENELAHLKKIFYSLKVKDSSVDMDKSELKLRNKYPQR